MKKLMWLLLFCVVSANAREIAWLPNNAGGKIVITNETCRKNGKNYEGLYRSFMYTKEGYTMNSCYYLDGSSIRMLYDNGQEMRYPVEDFFMNEQPKKGGSV